MKNLLVLFTSKTISSPFISIRVPFILSIFVILIPALSNAQEIVLDRWNYEVKSIQVRWNNCSDDGFNGKSELEFKMIVAEDTDDANTDLEATAQPGAVTSNKNYSADCECRCDKSFTSSLFSKTNSSRHKYDILMKSEEDGGLYDHRARCYGVRDVTDHAKNQWSSTIEFSSGCPSNGSDLNWKTIWRYTKGTKTAPIDFGVVDGTKFHINSNRSKPSDAGAGMGYTNDWGASSSPDVTYTFEIQGVGKRVSIRDFYNNFNSKIYLYDNSGNQITNSTGTITRDLCAGNYTVVVEGTNSSAQGEFYLRISTSDISTNAGSISASSSSACEGSPISEINSVSLATAGNIASGDITYKWFKAVNEGTFGEINGATGSSLTSSQAGTMPTSAPGADYVRFKRYAYACGGNEAQTAYVQISAPTAPAAPTNVNADSSVVGNFITVSWNHSGVGIAGDPVTGFIIERSGNGAVVEFEADAHERSYEDSDVLGCITYDYVVKVKTACFSAGVGDDEDGSILSPDLGSTFATDGTGFFASKGYFTNKIELTWINQNEGQTNKIRINRRILDSGDPFTLLTSENTGIGIYNDDDAEAGILYEYEIYAEGPCETETLRSNSATVIGFRNKSGRVSGQVKYKGAGNAVKDVLIEAESENNVQGGSIKFNGAGDLLRIENPSNLTLTNELFLETWIKPMSHISNYDIINRTNAYNLSLNATSDNIEFKVFYNGGSQKMLSIDQDSLMTGDWSHIAAQVREDSMFIYINGKLIDQKIISSGMSLDNPSNDVVIGEDLNGYLKELRIWNISKSDLNVDRDHSRYVNGSESGLRVFLPMNEAKGSFAYDRSKLDVSSFNRNHGEFINGLAWSLTEVPSINQLNYRAYTDENGNYLMNLPYFNAGETYTLTPIFAPHEFDPSNRLVFVGDGATVLNAVNFEDISSFRVQGRLTYEGTNSPCGVDGAFVKIDGDFVLDNGQPEKTFNGGYFDIQVPIGRHFIEVEQGGHIYSEGRFPPLGLTTDDKYNFQDDEPSLVFKDSTFITIIGKVVGGEREAQKPYGKTTNNIGVADITWESESGCVLKTIRTDTITGEYQVDLPPLRYQANVNVLSEVDANYYKFNGVGEIVAYDGPPLEKVIKDTTFFENGDPPIIDSINYNYEKIFQTFRKPSITVTGGDGENFTGEKYYVFRASDGTLDTLDLGFDAGGNLPFGWPVFIKGQSDPYRMMIKVFEAYTNKDETNGYSAANPKRDSVPTTVGTLYFNNTIADSSQFTLDDMYIGENGDIKVAMNDINSLDTLKSLIYGFYAGTPNFGGDRLKSLTIRYENQSDPTSNIYWDPSYLPGTVLGGEVFKGYVMGSRDLGGNWFTVGPEMPEFILRDPPGSGSTATREVGSSHTKDRSWSWKNENKGSTEDKINVGAKFVAGFGVSLETEVKNDISFGFEAEIKGGRSGNITETVETTEEWSTNSTTDQVGVGSDIYIGKSQNFEHSFTEILSIVPNAYCSDPSAKVQCLDPLGADYHFAKKIGFEMKPEGYNTNFIYSQSFILTRLIPELEKVRTALLQSSRYNSQIPDSDDRYGTDNDDPVWGASAADCGNEVKPCYELSDSGPSYIFNGDPEDTDSVRWINQQIGLWQDAIRLNEWEKANIDNLDTISHYKQMELDKLEDEYAPAIAATIATGVVLGAAAIVVSYGLIAAPLPGTAIAGNVTFAITTAATIANAEVAEEYETYLIKKQRIEDKFDAIVAKNYSISSGTSLTRTFATSMATSVTGSIEYSVATSIKTEVKGTVSGTGMEFEKGFESKFEYGRDWTDEIDSTQSVSFTLSDDDQPDYFSVDVYESILGFGPIFKMKEGGQTSCPYEDEVFSQFYKENDQPVRLSGKTRQIDVPEITVPKDKVTGVPANQLANFVVNLKNATLTGEAREFRLAVLSSSNPNGAKVRIDGLASNTIFLAADETVPKIITVGIGPDPTILEYDSIAVILYAPCQYEGGTSDNFDIVSTAYISAHFLPSCSEVEIQSPLDQWVVNNSFNDTLPIVLSGYDVNYGGLERFKFGYKKAEDPSFTIRESFWIDTTGQPNYLPLSSTSSATLYEWDIKNLNDGPYDLIMESACPINNLDADDIKSVSQVHSGYIDRINPHPFGTPSPADGILDPNDDILVRFNEPINAAQIEPENFQIIGMRNGSPIKNEVSLFFDGSDTLSIPEYQLQSRSFTIEFWLKRDALGEQVILSQGLSPSDQLTIAFNASNQLTFQLGQKVLTSTSSFTDMIDWHHYAVVYDRDNMNAEIIVDYGLDKSNNSFGTDYNSTGTIYVGQHAAGGYAPLNAFIHELRIWSIPRTTGEIGVKALKSMSGRETGLIGNWSMDEAYGNKAKDKVRRRDGTIRGASWSILPQNHSFAFDGIGDYLESSATNTWGLSDESDITIEGWFKTNSSGEQTLLSNGKADGTRPESAAWRVFLTSAGAVTIENDGNSISSTGGYNDDNWHHFSVVIERTKAVSLYMDSELVATGNASIYKNFVGPKIWMGCRGWYQNNAEMRDQFFEGNLDEIRIWNLARRPEQIQRDFVHQMNGDELGLQVYYPFNEVVIINNKAVRTTSLTDEGLQGFDLSLGGSTALDYDENAPPIKLPRLKSNIGFTFSINNDEIFIDITEDDFVVENVTLDITVEGIKDLAGNVMQSPETWIAYINKNQVFWEEEYFQFEKKLEDNLSFKAKIKNTGGSQESYSLGNLPSWLSASPSSGLIDPNSTIEVTFTVQPLLNIGEYEQDIYVSTESFGFNERLLLDLKVVVEPPLWEVTPDDFSHSMNIVGQFEINDVISTDPEDMVSVWVNDELRGVTHVEFDPSSGKHLVFLTVLSNVTSGELLEFRAWDASRGRLLKGLMPDDIQIIGGGIIGSRGNPIPIEATVLTQLQYVLTPGWNWISFPLAATVLNDINQTLIELSPTENDQMKYPGKEHTYSGGSWRGTDGLTTSRGYKIRVAKADTFRYEGTFMDPSLLTEQIEIDSGWNWIGVKSEFIIDVPSAMASLDPQTGDVIKGQRSFAIYEDGFGWGGNLDFLKPQVGYMLKYHKPDQLIYPGNLNARTRPETQLKSRSQRGKEYAALEKSLDYVTGKYSNTMSLIAEIDGCIALDAGEAELDLSQWSLAAHAGDECRGVVESTWQLSTGKYVYYLSIEGSTSVDLNFKLVHNTNGMAISLSQTMQFASNGVVGMNSAPYQFTCEADDCIESSLFQSGDIDMSQSVMDQRVMLDLRSNAILPSDRTYRFRAGNSIELMLGFEVSDRARLEAYIEDCITTKQ